jgi:hypothetical protein
MDKYSVCDAIGKGASGEVYLAFEKVSLHNNSLKKKLVPIADITVLTLLCLF